MARFIWCQECGQAVIEVVVSIPVPVVRGYVLCPDCLELIPDDVANAFLDAAKAAGEKRKAEHNKMRGV